MRKIICAILLFCLLLVACGSSSTPEPTATPVPTTPVQTLSVPEGFFTHMDPEGVFSILYPASWVLNQPPIFLLFSASLKNQEASVFIQLLPVPEATHDSAIKYAEEMVSRWQQSPNKYDLYAIEQRTAQGQEIATMEFMMTNPSGGKLHFLQAIMFAKNQVWTIVCSSVPELFDEYKKDFETIVDSLQIFKEFSPKETEVVPEPPPLRPVQ